MSGKAKERARRPSRFWKADELYAFVFRPLTREPLATGPLCSMQSRTLAPTLILVNAIEQDIKMIIHSLASGWHVKRDICHERALFLPVIIVRSRGTLT